MHDKDKQKVLDAYHSRKLWKKGIFINEDFSETTTELRRGLYAKRKEYQARGVKEKVVYNRLILPRHDGEFGEKEEGDLDGQQEE